MDIVVVGSINMDTVLSVDHLPARGETITADAHFLNPGGKGANQAVAAARLGRSVALVGCVGEDAAGDVLVETLEADGVDASAVERVEEPSGMAAITVGPEGENTIVVSPGANLSVTPDRVAEAAGLIARAAVVMVQLEIPVQSVATALDLATGMTILNPAPARRLDASLLGKATVIVPNETELAVLMDDPERPVAPTYAMLGAASLGDRVVVTMGDRGAVYVDGEDSGHIAAPVVDAVDSTAAGDAFCAALADALISGGSMGDAVTWGVRAGSITVTRRGAQSSLPFREEMA